MARVLRQDGLPLGFAHTVGVWWILGLMAAAGLALNFRAPNAVWGTATFAIVVGLALAFLKGLPIWDTVWKSITVGALMGVVFELLPRLVGRSNRKPPEWDHID